MPRPVRFFSGGGDSPLQLGCFAGAPGYIVPFFLLLASCQWPQVGDEVDSRTVVVHVGGRIIVSNSNSETCDFMLKLNFNRIDILLLLGKQQVQTWKRGGIEPGVLSNGNIAVKRIKSSHSIKETSFYHEVGSLLNIEHENVIRFLGFCASTDQIAIKVRGSKEHIYAEVRERLLCFEYINNGSLRKYITDELRGLEWKTRYEIIRGICEGLYHLHHEKKIYHMDMKPENILLDNDMVPKITDFGLSRLDEKSQTMSEVRLGSLGYFAPEYLLQGKKSFKSDMYSLGVIIIELVTGQKVIPKNKNNMIASWDGSKRLYFSHVDPNSPAMSFPNFPDFLNHV
ncbi:Cysteine-rich receptor-like protein kinase 26 [Triticum urartu]|uniref:Cysteine-rich receptor-like protein kinase 26 n=1 Tax=Triticum urartu TaxID=4572 RepID=M8ACB9_TRIUA|nr:Cysteine-rich receptor-like protein kinase 26 [Triticum urartu]